MMEDDQSNLPEKNPDPFSFRANGKPGNRELSISKPEEFTYIVTTHFLKGFIMLKETAVYGQDELSSQYLIEASGSAVSDAFGDGASMLEIVYHQATAYIKGVLNTQFNDVDVVQKFDGRVTIISDVNSIELNVSLNNAMVNSASKQLLLNEGAVSIVLPLLREGRTELTVFTKGEYSVVKTKSGLKG